MTEPKLTERQKRCLLWFFKNPYEENVPKSHWSSIHSLIMRRLLSWDDENEDNGVDITPAGRKLAETLRKERDE